MRAHRVLAAVVILAGCAALAAPAQAAEPFDAPGKTGGIDLVGSTNSRGVQWDFFRNRAYPCSVAGHQTFAVGTRIGSPATTTRPLWVRMRGGGVGFFDSTGTPRPSANNMIENSAKQLIGFSEENALNRLVTADPAGFRTLSVSMCSHDIYGGGDQPDPDNPNRTPDGRAPTVNGLFATKAAIQFVQRRYPTTKTFLHGTSAGSYGGWGLAWSLQRQDRPVAGFVADSGVVNLQYERDLNEQGGRCARGPEAIDAISRRLHPVLADPRNQPDRLIARGDLRAPVFDLWSRDDSNSCGETPVRCTMPDGSVRTLGGMECRMDRVSRAIAALPSSRRSRTWRLCVRVPRDAPGTCARHVVTNADGFPNTNSAFPADYNRAILDWVRFRLDDRPPALEPSFSRSAQVRARSGRVRLRCLPGGYERRTCRIGIRQLLGGGRTRKLGEGSRVVAEGTGSAVVTVKLNRLARRALQAAPRGVRLRLAMRATEDHTRRTGTAARRARLRR